ncbi:MAG: molybdopterin-dependent oxidoreductase, partial [Opitutales bacterium]|nr:molybdopterin-dependent oxidoreductase [Opitutales bacterium]
GVNTTVWSREGKIYRITPRENDAVNVVWMSDSGRMLYKTVTAETRLAGFRRGESEVTFDEAVDAALALMKDGVPAFVASGKMSVEEQFALKSLANAVGGNVYLAKTLGENDKMLISEDRSPNRRGALVTGLVKDFDSAEVSALAAKIDADEVKTVFVCGEDLKELGLTDEQLKKVEIVYLGTQANATSEEASVVLPGRTVFEKAGTFVNQEFRLQKFEVAVPGAKGTENDLIILSTLAARAASGVALDNSLASVWEKLRAACPVLADIDYANIPDAGTLLDASPWANIAFPETGSLKWSPKK